MAKVDKMESALAEIGIGRMVDIPIRGYLPSGSASLDYAISGKLSGGGYPLGRIVELYGDPAAGKTLLLTQAVATAQKAGWAVFLDDSENALDKFFAESVGANPDELYYANSESVEGHYKRVSIFIKKIREKDPEVPILICLDSLAMLSTTHERGVVEDVKGGDDGAIPEINPKRDMTKAQLVRAALRVLATKFMKENVLYLCSNHTTAVIGGSLYGPKTTTPGGSGIKFAASVRVDLSRGTVFKNADGPTGHIVRASITKNKVAPPFKRVNFNMFFDRGVEPYSGFLEILQNKEIAHEGGGWWTIPSVYGDKKFRSVDLEKQLPEVIAALKDIVAPVLETQTETETSESQDET